MNESVAESFNVRLRQTMKSCKITCRDIAKSIGKSKNQISNYFSGKSAPPWNDTIKLIEFLQRRIGNLDLNFLFGTHKKNGLLNTIQRLQRELSSLQSAYDNLIMEYVLLQDTLRNPQKLVQNEKNIRSC